VKPVEWGRGGIETRKKRPQAYALLWLSPKHRFREVDFSGVIVSLYPASIMIAATEAISDGRQARNEGNFPVAREHYAEAAKIYREQNDVLAYAHTIRHIADIYQQERNSIEAKPLYEEALELYRGNLNTKLLDLANTVRPYALLNEKQGNLGLARKLWEEARNLYGSLRLEAGVSECDTHLSQLQDS
jgi:tetratricopeptide (TPR) repeat protein